MTTEELKLWAIDRATDIVKREGVKLALATARKLNEEALGTESALLTTAIACSIMEAYDLGKPSKVTEWDVDRSYGTRLEVIGEQGSATN